MFFRLRKQAKKRRAHRVLRMEPIEPRRMLAVITVNTHQDFVDPNDQLTSIREAFEMANNLEGPDEIVFDFGHDEPRTIRLEHGELELTDEVTITGPGRDLLTIDAQHQSRILNISANRADFVINGLTLTNGRVSETNIDGRGGAIRSTTRGILAIGDVTVRNSFASDAESIFEDNGDGAIYSLGNVSIDSSVISDNRGAAVYAMRAVVDIRSSEISRNQGSGIIANEATITSSTFSDNKGRAVFVRRAADIHNSTISANHGGGISVDGRVIDSGGNPRLEFAGSVTVSFSTIVGNSIESVVAPGAGIRSDFGGGIDASGDISVVNSIVAGNVLNKSCWCSDSFQDAHARTFAAELSSWGQSGSVTVRHSLIGHNGGTTLVETPLGNPDSNGNLIGGPDGGVIDPRIGPLSDNGGLTLTHPLLSDSPAIDAGDPLLAADISQFDQRGGPYERTERGRADMGAYQRQDLTAAIANIASPTLQPVDSVTIEFTRPVTGLDVTDFRLSRNTDADLLTGNELLSTTDSQKFVLSGLSNVADAPGFYTLTLSASESEIQAADNTPLDSSVSVSWTMGRSVLGLTVDTLIDEVDGRIDDGDISLRDALTLAAPGETITFDSSLDGGTLMLTLGELRINRSVTVDAKGLAGGLVIDASGNDPTPDENDGLGSRVFVIDDGDWLTDSPTILRGLVLTGGDVDSAGGAILTQETLSLEAITIFGNSSVPSDSRWNHSELEQALDFDNVKRFNDQYYAALNELHYRAATSTRLGRGAISGSGDLTVSLSTISENVGSGIVTFGSVTVRSSTVSKNAGTGVMAGENVVVDASTISENDWVGIGGSLVTIDSSTVSENGATGIGAADSVNVHSSTISENNTREVRFSAGISARAPIIVNSSTITENIGGIYVSGRDPVSITNSILAGNRGRRFGGEPSGDLDLHFPRDFQWHIRHSLIGNNGHTGLPEAPIGSLDANGNLIGGPTNGVIDPRLAPRRDNGGPTFTHALLPDSPAINMGDPSAVIDTRDIPPFDQRGEPYARAMDGRIDMGAFESRPVGDSNGDGVFDSLDLVMVLQAGKYEDDVANNTTFEEGDWNGDGDFDRYDVVFALQAGNYIA